MTKKVSVEQELAELRKETESLLEEIEKLEDEIHEERAKKYKSDCSVAMRMMKTYFEEANEAGISNHDAMAMLSMFIK